jgi:hypothetical protein
LIQLQELQERITLDKRHCYRVNRATVPGVTTVIKTMDAPALDAWKVRVQVEGTARAAFRHPPQIPETLSALYAEEELLAAEVAYVEELTAIAKREFEHERLANEAADVGKQVHALIEHAVKEQLGQETTAPEATDEALFVFAGWREWAESVGLEPLMAEGRVHHGVHGYAGSFDLLCLIDGRPAIADWKPQPKAWPERRLQSAAYRRALMDHGWPPLDGYLVGLPRDGGEIEMLQLENGEDLRVTFEAFKSCLYLYNWQKELAKRARDEARESVAV